MTQASLPIAIIGAGPIGLAAAAHAVSRNLTPIVFEAGETVGAGVLRWAHVRMFSPWRFNVDPVAAGVLRRHGWTPPHDEEYPTGADLVERYLQPLASTPEIAAGIRLATRVRAVSRVRHDRMKDGNRHEAAYVLRVIGPAGEEDILASAVIDASGTIESPGPLGASGVPAIGERALADRIFYGIPDVLGTVRRRYAGRRVLVVGSGHSAFNALIDLVRLAEDVPETHVQWAVRRSTLTSVFGGGTSDQLEERGKLGLRLRRLIEQERLTVATDFHLDRLTETPQGIVAGSGPDCLSPVDEIVAATGFRPNWSMLSELRLELDPAVESAKALAPLIDPNMHSCGTVPPHGAEVLKHPDRNVFVVGMKSYGRAPTFLMLTGYEQVRSVVCAIAGDWEAARRVELVLPETGVCSLDRDPPIVGAGLRPALLASATACCAPSSGATQAITIETISSGAAVRSGQKARATSASGDRVLEPVTDTRTPSPRGCC